MVQDANWWAIHWNDAAPAGGTVSSPTPTVPAATPTTTPVGTYNPLAPGQLGVTTDAFGRNGYKLGTPPAIKVRYRQNRKPVTDPKTGVTTVYGEIKFSEFRGGLKNYGALAVDGHRLAPIASTATPLDWRNPGTGVLAQQITTTTLSYGDATSGVTSTNIFGTLVAALGATANKSLLKESGGVMGYLTYSPGNAILSLNNIVIGGFTQALRLGVGRVTGVVDVLSDVASTPTDYGDMHANTANCWGIATSFVGGGTLIIFTSTKLYTLLCSAAVGDAPTDTGTIMNGGGWLIGFCNLQGYPNDRLFINEATETGSTLFRVVHVNAEGTDKQYLSSCPLSTTPVAFKYNDEIFLSDQYTAYLYNGQRYRLVNWNKELPGDARIVGAWPRPGGLYIEYAYANAAGNRLNYSVLYWDDELDQMGDDAIFEIQGSRSENVSAMVAWGTLPFSNNTKNYHFPVRGGATATDVYWVSQYAPPPGYNTFSGRQQVSIYGGLSYEASGSFQTPYLEIEGLEGFDKVTTDIAPLGDVNAGGTTTSNATITITAGGMTSTITASSSHSAPNIDHPSPKPNNNKWRQLRVSGTATRNSGDVNFTPNVAPFVVRFRCYVPPGNVVDSYLPPASRGSTRGTAQGFRR